VSDAEADADAHVRTPLAHLAGERPPAPAWFETALAQAPERSVVAAAGVEIELLAWGGQGAPGLLFIHGGMAHADWWSFIAPFFAGERRVAALSLSGMGATSWRERYTPELHMAEALAAAEAAGLFEAGPPLVVGHSFGGGVASYLARHAGERLAGAVMLDAGVRPPDMRFRGPRPGNRPDRVYPDLAAILGRFRLAPSQPCSELYLLDHIARGSVREVEGGWRWRFDPNLWDRMDGADRGSQEEELAGARCPLAVVWGARSRLMTPEVVAYTRAHAPPGTPFFAVPEAEHHVMLDQPLALVAALRGLFSAWPPPR
jgi:pimeloyl-ACP methyl ester carboxylesterase